MSSVGREFERSKMIGGIGAILTAISFHSAFLFNPLSILLSLPLSLSGIPLSIWNIVLSWGIWSISTTGLILVLSAMKSFSEVYGEKPIFSNVLYGYIINIVGGIIFGIIIVFAFSTAIAKRITYSTYLQLSPAELYSILTESIGVLILAWIVIVLFAISGAIFYRTAFKLLAEKSGEKLFDTAGLLMLIGAVLTIIVIGGILTLIAWILAAVAFFSIKPPPATAPQPPPLSPQ